MTDILQEAAGICFSESRNIQACCISKVNLRLLSHLQRPVAVLVTKILRWWKPEFCAVSLTGKVVILTRAMEGSETDRNGNGPRGVLHRLVREDGMQERDEEGLKKKESTACINGTLWNGMPIHETTLLTQSSQLMPNLPEECVEEFFTAQNQADTNTSTRGSKASGCNLDASRKARKRNNTCFYPARGRPEGEGRHKAKRNRLQDDFLFLIFIVGLATRLVGS